MARYRNSRVKIVRRLGVLPGFTSKKSNVKKLANFSFNRRLSQYGLHLQEKQKLRYNYGITESQLLKYVKKAKKLEGNTGEVLLKLLEMRLDNIIYRSGLAPTVSAARQLISHGHVLVNKKRINIANYSCQTLDKITIKCSLINDNFLQNSIPSYLSINNESNEYIQIFINDKINLKMLELSINILLVLEYYSGR